MTDPSSPNAWQDAERIAKKAARGELTKRSDALPFMFMASSPASVLVHRGKVVKAKGPAAAGDYLRDLGVLEGKGPGIEDILYVLYHFQALPEVKETSNERYIHKPNQARLKDLTARIESDGEKAQVVLHYFLPEKPMPDGVDVGAGPGPGPGAPPGGMTMTRPVARVILTIPKEGDASWGAVETIQWSEPN